MKLNDYLGTRMHKEDKQIFQSLIDYLDARKIEREILSANSENYFAHGQMDLFDPLPKKPIII